MKTLFLLLLLPTLALAEDLRILTWNVFMLPKPIKSSRQKERTKEIANYFQDSEADVIFLQEAFSGGFRKHIESSLQEKYPHSLQMKKKRGLLPIFGPGLMVLAKYPLKEIALDYYDKCSSFDCYASKGVHLIELTLPSGKKVQIANTHMQAGRGEKKEKIRHLQLMQIQDLLGKNLQPGVPQLLVGDLNIDAISGDEFKTSLVQLGMEPSLKGFSFSEDESEEERQKLSDRIKNFVTSGFEAGCLKAGTTNPKLVDHVLYFDLDRKIRVVDDQVLNPTFMVEEKSCPLSDHKPRFVRLEF